MTSTRTAAATPAADLPQFAMRVFNTLSKEKEPFEPLVPGQVGIYLCGPTVYKPSHIGHMVGPVIFDTIKRFLVYSGYKVTLVINVTDVDDKLINESRNRGMTMSDLALEMEGDYMANLKAMGVRSVDHFPRATENMAEIIAFTQALVDKGFAYAALGGDVYFDVARDAEYGKLSRRSIEELEGQGGDMAERKRSAADFALWKGAKPGEPAWDSPWGPGRPGWHIECSAMSRRILGESFDIHGGGLDLVFPHHENEIAQSECCHGRPQAKYWLHNGLMQAADEVGKVGGRNTRTAGETDAAQQEAGKMGKSKGASAFRDLLARHRPETIRFFLLATHYRRPIFYSEERLSEIETTNLETFYRLFKRYERITGRSFYTVEVPERRTAGEIDAKDDPMLTAIASERQRFLEAMDDDFNTGGGTGHLFDLARLLNRYIDSEKLEGAAAPTAAQAHVLETGARVIRELGQLLGLFEQPPAAGVDSADNTLVEGLLNLLIAIRLESRAAKNYQAGDRIRNDIAAAGVVLEDRQGRTDFVLPQSAEGLANKLMQVLIALRAEARQSKQFALADRVRQGTSELGIVLEDRAGGTEWSVPKR